MSKHYWIPVSLCTPLVAPGEGIRVLVAFVKDGKPDWCEAVYCNRLHFGYDPESDTDDYSTGFFAPSEIRHDGIPICAEITHWMPPPPLPGATVVGDDDGHAD